MLHIARHLTNYNDLLRHKHTEVEDRMNTNTENKRFNDSEEKCGGCGRRCLLTELKCEKGRRLNGVSETEAQDHGRHDEHGDNGNREHGEAHGGRGRHEAHGHEEGFAHRHHGEEGHHEGHGYHGEDAHHEGYEHYEGHGHHGCRGHRKQEGEGHHGDREGRQLPFDIDAEGTKGLYARLRECGHYLFHRQGAYVGQERVLKELSENGGTMSQRELTERLQLQRASVSEILGKLELRALIVREQSMSDRRSQDIRLTAEGIRAAEEIAGRQTAEYDELFEEIAEEEQKTLYELLGKLLEKWRGRQK